MQQLSQGAAKLGIELTAPQLEQFEAYYREIITWNQKFNLTAITDYEAVQTKHFLDSLTMALSWDKPPANLLDVGSGAGLPGLALKIAFPEIAVTLLEATGKKAGFIEHAAQELGLSGVKVIHDRAEIAGQKPACRESFEAVTARAVAEMAALAELTLPFARVGGYGVCYKKGDITQETADAHHTIERLGGQLRPPLEIEIEELGEKRYLIIMDKIKSTPPEYPRRNGLPQHQPLKDAA